MEKQCKNCKFFRRLKHNFEVIKGYEESFCCVLWIKTDDDAETFVIETSSQDMCEMFSERK